VRGGTGDEQRGVLLGSVEIVARCHAGRMVSALTVESPRSHLRGFCRRAAAGMGARTALDVNLGTLSMWVNPTFTVRVRRASNNTLLAGATCTVGYADGTPSFMQRTDNVDDRRLLGPERDRGVLAPGQVAHVDRLHRRCLRDRACCQLVGAKSLPRCLHGCGSITILRLRSPPPTHPRSPAAAHSAAVPRTLR
jgi:hypothetical protein